MSRCRLYPALAIATLALAGLYSGPAVLGQERGVPPSNPPRTTLRVVALPYLSFAPFFIAQEEGYFADESLDIVFERFHSTGQYLPAFVEGKIHVGAGSLSAGFFNAVARGARLRVVADKGIFRGDGPTTGLLARKYPGHLDPIEVLRQQKTIRASVGTKYGYYHYMTETILTKLAVPTGKLQLMPLTAMESAKALADGSIDICNMAQPALGTTMRMGVARELAPFDKVVPEHHAGLIFYGPDLLERRPNVGLRFMRAYARGAKQYLDGKTDRNLSILAKHTGLPTEELRTMGWFGINPDLHVNVAQIMDFQQWCHAQGLTDRILNREEWEDSSFREQALQQVGLATLPQDKTE